MGITIKSGWVVTGLLAVSLGCAHAPPPTAATKQDAAPPPAPGLASPAQAGASHEPAPVKFPGIKIDLKEGTIDLEGRVCLRDGLLELVATVTAGKEHEAIVAVRARPSHVHAALLMLGLKPGRPGKWLYEKDRVVPVDPTGDRVRLSLRWQKDGQWIEKPINEFVRNRQSDQHLESDEFIFAGSRVFDPPDGDPVYLADESGDIASLVSFDLELLAVPKAASNSNDQVFWTADPKTLPELDTPIVLRIRPVKEVESQKSKVKSRENKP